MIEWLQVVGVAFIALGAFLTLVTAIGMHRLHSLFARMHASTKPQVLGLVLMCAGLACVMQSTHVAATLVLVVMMQFVVAPLSAARIAAQVPAGPPPMTRTSTSYSLVAAALPKT